MIGLLKLYDLAVEGEASTRGSTVEENVGGRGYREVRQIICSRRFT